MKNIMPWLMIGGVAYAAYWYLTNYGPGGKVGPTYWDMWFGNGFGGVSPAAVAGGPQLVTSAELAAAQQAGGSVWDSYRMNTAGVTTQALTDAGINPLGYYLG